MRQRELLEDVGSEGPLSRSEGGSTRDWLRPPTRDFRFGPARPGRAAMQQHPRLRRVPRWHRWHPNSCFAASRIVDNRTATAPTAPTLPTQYAARQQPRSIEASCCRPSHLTFLGGVGSEQLLPEATRVVRKERAFPDPDIHDPLLVGPGDGSRCMERPVIRPSVFFDIEPVHG
jgi:hypothetical protein